MKFSPPIFVDKAVRQKPGSCSPLIQAAETGAVRLRATGHGAYPGVRLPPNLLPELRSVGFWDATKEQAWGLDWHRNEGIEFTYLFNGSLDFASDDRTKELHPGHLTVTRPWQIHRVGTPHVGASKLGWVILDVGVRRPNQDWTWPEWVMLTEAERKRLTTLLRGNDQLAWRSDASVTRAFQNIISTTEQSQTHFDRTGMILGINQLLLASLHMLEDRKIELDISLTSSQRTVEIFLAQLKHRSGEVWSLERMANECGLKRTQFADYCRSLKNQPPLIYLNQCRIDAACLLLRTNHGLSISEIALECGYASSQMFATAFRRSKGMAPREYRAKSL